MFGLGMTELLVIFVVALLFLGPDKLPEAAKKLSRGIRDFRQHGKELQRTLDEDTDLGEAVRDLKSALRGEDGRPIVARYDHPATESPPKAAKGDTDEEPVERESSQGTQGQIPLDPYDLRGEELRAARAAEAAAEEASDASEDEDDSPVSKPPGADASGGETHG